VVGPVGVVNVRGGEVGQRADAGRCHRDESYIDAERQNGYE